MEDYFLRNNIVDFFSFESDCVQHG